MSDYSSKIYTPSIEVLKNQTDIESGDIINSHCLVGTEIEPDIHRATKIKGINLNVLLNTLKAYIAGFIPSINGEIIGTPVSITTSDVINTGSGYYEYIPNFTILNQQGEPVGLYDNAVISFCMYGNFSNSYMTSLAVQVIDPTSESNNARVIAKSINPLIHTSAGNSDTPIVTSVSNISATREARFKIIPMVYVPTNGWISITDENSIANRMIMRINVYKPAFSDKL